MPVQAHRGGRQCKCKNIRTNRYKVTRVCRRTSRSRSKCHVGQTTGRGCEEANDHNTSANVDHGAVEPSTLSGGRRGVLSHTRTRKQKLLGSTPAPLRGGPVGTTKEKTKNNFGIYKSNHVGPPTRAQKKRSRNRAKGDKSSAAI